MTSSNLLRTVKTPTLWRTALPNVLSVLWFAILRELYFPDNEGNDSVFYVVAWGIFFWTVVLLTREPRRITKQASFCFLVSVLLIGVLWRFPWTPRQTFFRRVTEIRVGTPLADAEEKLASYRPAYPHQFNGRNGPSARPLPAHFTGGMVYLRDSHDPDSKDYNVIVFEQGKVVNTSQMAD